MDPSILRGEQSSSKKQKVVFYCLLSNLPFHLLRDVALIGFVSIFLFQIVIGLLHGNSQVIFEKSESSSLNLIGKCLTCEHTTIVALTYNMCTSLQNIFEYVTLDHKTSHMGQF